MRLAKILSGGQTLRGGQTLALVQGLAIHRGVPYEIGIWGAMEPGTQLSLKPQRLKLSLHTLRHTHGYHIIQAGGHLGDVVESLGSRLDQVFDVNAAKAAAVRIICVRR